MQQTKTCKITRLSYFTLLLLFSIIPCVFIWNLVPLVKTAMWIVIRVKEKSKLLTDNFNSCLLAANDCSETSQKCKDALLYCNGVISAVSVWYANWQNLTERNIQCCTGPLPQVLRSFSEEATDFSDLLQCRDHPFVIGSELLYKAIYPLDLLGVSVLQPKTTKTTTTWGGGTRTRQPSQPTRPARTWEQL